MLIFRNVGAIRIAFFAVSKVCLWSSFPIKTVVRVGGGGSRSVPPLPPKVYVINQRRLYFQRNMLFFSFERDLKTDFLPDVSWGKCLLGVELIDSGATKMLVEFIFFSLNMANDYPHCTARLEDPSYPPVSPLPTRPIAAV